jgi:hypothetical protein
MRMKRAPVVDLLAEIVLREEDQAIPMSTIPGIHVP